MTPRLARLAGRASTLHGSYLIAFRDLFAVRRGGDSVRLRDVKEPMLVIAGNGMCSGGRIVGHLQKLLPREQTCVLFVGFQAPGTVETPSGLSAHADRGELVRWLGAIPDVRNVALHHGEPDAQRELRAWAAERIAGGTARGSLEDHPPHRS